MKSKLLKKLGILLTVGSLFTGALTSTRVFAQDQSLEPEIGDKTHGCVYLISSPGDTKYSCTRWGTVCDTDSDCKLK